MPPSLRIVTHEPRSAPVAAWVAGLVLTMLAVGTYGAMQTLLPTVVTLPQKSEDEIAVMDFLPSSEEAAPAETHELATPEEVELPPLPEVTLPLAPPEVPELQPLEEPPPTPQQTPPKPVEPTPKPKPKSEPPSPRRASPSATASTRAGSTGSATVMTGIGTGRFPAPSYPYNAKAARQQGTVRLLITVETSGIPSAVEVLSSSGFAALDSAASDQIRRRWRWPSGDVRKFIAPILFQLQ